MKFATLLLSAAALGASLRADVTDILSQSASLPASHQLVIVNVNGPISVKTWAGSTVEVTATRSARTQKNLDRIAVKVETTGDVLAIKSVQPDRETGTVAYEIRVPRETVLRKVHSSQGDIAVDGISGGVDANALGGAVRVNAAGGTVVVRSANDPVEISGTAGRIVAQSTNGSIRLSLGNPAAGTEVTAASANGPIVVALDGAASAAIKASTKNGELENSLGLPTAKRGFGGRTLDAMMNGGTTAIQLQSINGAIRLERS